MKSVFISLLRFRGGGCQQRCEQSNINKTTFENYPAVRPATPRERHTVQAKKATPAHSENDSHCRSRPRPHTSITNRPTLLSSTSPVRPLAHPPNRPTQASSEDSAQSHRLWPRRATSAARCRSLPWCWSNMSLGRSPLRARAHHASWQCNHTSSSTDQPSPSSARWPLLTSSANFTDHHNLSACFSARQRRSFHTRYVDIASDTRLSTTFTYIPLKHLQRPLLADGIFKPTPLHPALCLHYIHSL